jgi:hypothetical protein
MKEGSLVNGTNGNARAGRVEFLKQKLDADRAALAAEMVKRAKRQQRENEKLQAVIGGAVLKACAQSPEFKLMICQTALCNITDDAARKFLTGRGWL